MLLEDKKVTTGTFVNVPSGTFPNYITPGSTTTQRQGKAA
jgi:hypothetical protein